MKPTSPPHAPEIFRVREGATGILTLAAGGREQTYLPNYDMDAARALLLEFQELKNSENQCLKDCYREGEFDWYPTVVSQLYWYVFFPWIKYQPLAEDWLAGKKDFRHEGGGNFAILMGHFQESPRGAWRQRLHDVLWRLVNARAMRRHRAELMFYRFALRDFRSVEIRATMDELKIRYLQAVPAPSTRALLQSLLRGDPYYYFPQPNKTIYGNRFRKSFDLSGLPAGKRSLFSAAIRLLEGTLTTCIREWKFHRNMLANSGIKAFYGFDDANTCIFPLLYAARSLRLPTVGHQHGAYIKRHAGYMMEGLSPESFPWFDKVIVWGRYWRDKMLRDAPIHPPERWLIGTNKLKLPYLASGEVPVCSPRPSNVLIPYEFLADTAAIGRYITRLVELGYTVWFRARTDESLDAQVDAYQLAPDICARLQMATGPLDKTFLDGIDIVAGTMTTLVYELLPAGKIIWYLDTPYRHLYDLVEEGLAHHIRLDDLRPPGEMSANFLTPIVFSAEKLFGNESLTSVLAGNVAPLVQ